MPLMLSLLQHSENTAQFSLLKKRASLVAQLVKNPPAMQETWVQTLGWEDPLEKERLPTPVFWPGEFHGLYSSWGCKQLDTIEGLSLYPSIKKINKI